MDTLIKQPSESIMFYMNMSKLGRLGDTDTIASVDTVTPVPTGPTITELGSDGAATARFRVSGGVDKTTYKLTVAVTTTLGDTLHGEGKLRVEDL